MAPAVAFSLAALSGRYMVRGRGSALVYEARNWLVNAGTSDIKKQSLDENISHYLFVDSDMSFSEEHIRMLVEARKPIISGACESRRKRGHYCAGSFGPYYSIGTYKDDTEKGVQEVEWVGGAFLMVAREAFEQMEYPWFRHVYVDMGFRANQTGEDIGFCINAKNSGIPIFVHLDCKIKHHFDG
jgi:GT2 family glycosyltransferase